MIQGIVFLLVLISLFWLGSKYLGPGNGNSPGSTTNEINRDVSNAIIILATSEPEGVHAEYLKITELHGERDKEWFLMRQSTFEQDGKHYDELQIKLANDEEKTYLFDITSFYGNF